jgi:hypothetical protein
MVHLQNTHDSNGLKATAIEYLKYLSGLEIMAGQSFIEARDDLTALGKIDEELFDRLTHAFQEEVRHAHQVRNMLASLGFKNKRELTQVMFWLQRTLVQVLNAFPPDHRPYLRILLNHLLEGKLLTVGNAETFACMSAIARTVPESEAVPIVHAALEFHDTVQAEEPSHIELDEILIEKYAVMYPQIERNAAMKALRSHGTPFRRAIRAKRELVRACAVGHSS